MNNKYSTNHDRCEQVCSPLVPTSTCRLAKALECLATLASAVAGASLHLAESSAPLGTGNNFDRNTALIASRAWIMLLRPFLQLGIGMLWSMSVWIAIGEDGVGGEGRMLLHPLLIYLVPACLGSISVWFALD
eukprot:COSAG02_NODE_933_length_15812_cov_68.551709_3_plen_133_part_00